MTVDTREKSKLKGKGDPCGKNEKKFFAFLDELDHFTHFTLISLQINQKLGKLASFMYFVEVAKKQETRDKKYECVSWFHYHK